MGIFVIVAIQKHKESPTFDTPYLLYSFGLQLQDVQFKVDPSAAVKRDVARQAFHLHLLVQIDTQD